MTSGQRQGPALEIVQTRDISVADRRELSRLWEKLLSRNGVDRLYTVSFYLWYAFAAFLTQESSRVGELLERLGPVQAG